MVYEYEGTVFAIRDISKNDFAKKQLVIRNISGQNNEFTHYAAFEVAGRYFEDIETWEVGDYVKVVFYVESREGKGEWEGNWFTDVRFYKGELKRKKADYNKAAAHPAAPAIPKAADIFQEADDMPF